jgi:hypothetical protein
LKNKKKAATWKSLFVYRCLISKKSSLYFFVVYIKSSKSFLGYKTFGTSKKPLKFHKFLTLALMFWKGQMGESISLTDVPLIFNGYINIWGLYKKISKPFMDSPAIAVVAEV